ncbi:hypothetical protein R1flu_007384 [Riccia fluitans]|uniref:WASP family protein member n=1 Tax=Riccia fluitans TaxID=41844 RepID=A0ABD1YZI7_9MARC
MLQSRKTRPFEEVTNFGNERKPMKDRPMENKARSFKVTPYHGSKTAAARRLSPTRTTDGRKVKGTPWSKVKNTIQHTPLPEIRTLNLTSDSLRDMHAAHTQLSEAFQHVGDMVKTAHRLHRSDDLSDDEIMSFTSAITDMTEELKKWQSIFKVAKGRWHSSGIPEASMHSDETSPSDISFSCLDNNSISGSPLVPCSLQSSLFCLTPLSRASLLKRDLAAIAETGDIESKLGEVIQSLYTVSPPKLAAERWGAFPEIPIVGSPKSDPQVTTGDGSPLPATPRIISPPRSVQLKGPVSSSEESFPGTPPHLRELLSKMPGTPPSSDLQTPSIPEELVLKYPRYFRQFTTTDSPSTPIPETPGFEGSPPRTCVPITVTKGCFADSSEICTPPPESRKYLETPFVTPGSVLPPETPTSSWKYMTPLVDDITASAIKRMGVKDSFGGPRSGVNSDLGSINENNERVLDSVSEEISGARQHGNPV